MNKVIIIIINVGNNFKIKNTIYFNQINIHYFQIFDQIMSDFLHSSPGCHFPPNKVDLFRNFTQFCCQFNFWLKKLAHSLHNHLIIYSSSTRKEKLNLILFFLISAYTCIRDKQIQVGKDFYLYQKIFFLVFVSISIYIYNNYRVF